MTAARRAVAGAAGVGVLATLPAGGRAFATAVLVWGAAVLLEVAALLAVGGQRPLVPASAAGAVGAPAALLGAGAASWERLPLVMAFMVLGAFVLALAAPRKRDMTTVLGVTVLPALVVGLGTAGMLVLRTAAAGFRWTLGMIAVAVLPALVGGAVGRFADPAADTPARVISAGAIGGALLLAMSPPLGIVTTVVLVVLGVVAGLGAAALIAVLPGGAHQPGWADGMVLTALAAPLLAAPAVAFLALTGQV